MVINLTYFDHATGVIIEKALRIVLGASRGPLSLAISTPSADSGEEGLAMAICSYVVISRSGAEFSAWRGYDYADGH